MGQGMGRPGLNRRHLLAAAGGLTVAGSFGFAALGTGADAPASDAGTRVRYWNLFSGGDGYKFFRGVPRELEEAAFIDGAGRRRVFFTIVLPLSRPSPAAVGIFTFISSWNNFLWPYMVTDDPDLMTMPNGIATVMNSYGVQWAQLMAGGLLAGLPLIVVFVFFQRQIVAGVAHTGLAGQ